MSKHKKPAKDFISDKAFKRLTPLASVRLLTANRNDSLVIHPGDIIVTLPAGTTREVQAGDDDVSDEEGGERFHFDEQSFAQSLPADDPLMLVLQDYYAIKQQELDAEPFGSDDEYEEFEYQGEGKRGRSKQCSTQQLWHAEVTDIREDPLSKQKYVDIAWFYRPQDFDEVKVSKTLQPFVDAMGRDELILSTHHNVNSATAIFGKSPIVRFSYTRCDLRPMSHTDIFTVSGTSVANGAEVPTQPAVVTVKKNVFQWVPNSQPKICRQSACKHKCVYYPTEHVVRWCEACERWYHRDCLTKYGGKITKEMRPVALYYGHSRSFPESHALLAKLLMLPIQRAPPHIWTDEGKAAARPQELRWQYPFSFEMLICKARTLLGQEPSTVVLPSDEHAWLMYNMGHAHEAANDDPTVVKEIERRIKQLFLLPIPAIFQ
ncbi:hypothetical protein L226DRAFT_573080, partial [Lentinus tigrinus ALCF2SS1-7]|uniref:uncharacterized protein n=1 Tax=Lentinus tigrinus ALCF2SS1-7 TaxID=1328758 RepID=UPI001165FD6C